MITESIRWAILKRQAEYLAGRICAIKAINLFDDSVMIIPIELNRSLTVSSHIALTITHAHNAALSMIATKDCVHFLGSD